MDLAKRPALSQPGWDEPDGGLPAGPRILLIASNLLTTFRLERKTKKKVRYEEVMSDMPPRVGTLYLHE
jgi:hypothetical protein